VIKRSPTTAGHASSGHSGSEFLGVLAETAYPREVASARVRIANFAPLLRDHGIELHYRPTLTESDYRLLATRGHVVRKAATLGRASARAVVRPKPSNDLLLVHRLRLLNPVPAFDPPRYLDVYDIDDALFAPFTTGGVNRRFRWTKQEARRCIECLRRSRLVLAGNSFLAGHAGKHARRVEVMPSCVEPREQPVRAHHDEHEVTVGWIGSPTTTPYLHIALPAVARLNADGVRAKLVLVGADRTLTAPWIEHHPWSLATERDHLASFDIGIMPQPDDEWARGKCGYKVLQYFAAGIPAVGSPVGITSALIGSDRGLVADSSEQWYQALNKLIVDPAERRERGVAGRAFVERNYSYQRWAPELAQLLRSLAT
jgi:glycosyltransferase involved in cell wall biosynthesis